MKRTITKSQAAALADECEEMLRNVPLIKQQIQDKINLSLSTEEPQEQYIKDLEHSLQCVKDQVSFYSDAFRSYSRRNGKLKEEAEKDSADNLEKYAAIRRRFEDVLSDFEIMGAASLRRIKIRQMAAGVFVLPPQPGQQTDAQILPASDEEPDE